MLLFLLIKDFVNDTKYNFEPIIFVYYFNPKNFSIKN